MAIIGWLVVTILAFYAWVVTIGGAYAELGFTGKISGWALIPLVFASALTYAAWISMPFEVVMK